MLPRYRTKNLKTHKPETNQPKSKTTRPEVYSCAQVSTLRLSESVIQEMAKILPFYGQIWSSNGPSYWFFLNHNQCAQGHSMTNFTILGLSHSPLFLAMAKIWPFYGQNMILTWSFKLVLPES